MLTESYVSEIVSNRVKSGVEYVVYMYPLRVKDDRAFPETPPRLTVIGV